MKTSVWYTCNQSENSSVKLNCGGWSQNKQWQQQQKHSILDNIDFLAKVGQINNENLPLNVK